jgi:transcriptional regulator with PAS, ATPase and Fis domain
MNHSPDLYRQVFKSAGEAIFVAGGHPQHIIEANNQAARLTGHRLEDLVGMPLNRIFQPCVDPGSQTEFPDSQNLEPLRESSSQLLVKGGPPLAVRVTTGLAPVEAGTCLVAIVRPEQSVASGDSTADGGDTWAEEETFPAIIGRSDQIHHLCRLVGSVARSDLTVLIQGESGTGKEVFAHAIHHHSHRARGQFVRVNCAALTETLLESELFGHVKGAFTGALRDRQGRFKQADGGTLLLDEIGSMSLSGQAKLLRILQEREFEPVGSSITRRVDVRVIATTNTDLAKAVRQNTFREDLYYRLGAAILWLPPLRERQKDVPLLAEHFLRAYCRTVGTPIKRISPEALSALVKYDWPGNVRELENAIEYAVIIEKGDVIRVSSLPATLTAKRGSDRSDGIVDLSLRDKLKVLERQILLDTLARYNWAKKEAAARLGIDARNMSYFLRKHNLSPESECEHKRFQHGAESLAHKRT